MPALKASEGPVPQPLIPNRWKCSLVVGSVTTATVRGSLVAVGTGVRVGIVGTDSGADEVGVAVGIIGSGVLVGTWVGGDTVSGVLQAIKLSKHMLRRIESNLREVDCFIGCIVGS